MSKIDFTFVTIEPMFIFYNRTEVHLTHPTPQVRLCGHSEQSPIPVKKSKPTLFDYKN